MSGYGRCVRVPDPVLTLDESIGRERVARLAIPGGYHYWKARGDEVAPREEHWCDFCAGWFGVPHDRTHPCRMTPHLFCACIESVVADALARVSVRGPQGDKR